MPGRPPGVHGQPREPSLSTLPTQPEPSRPSAPSDPAVHAALGRIQGSLRRLRTQAWTLLVAQRAGWLLAAAILATVIGGTADYFLRSPEWLRTGGLILAVGALGFFVWSWLTPALRFRPSLTEVALRVERSEAGRGLDLRGLLASGLELGERQRDLPLPALAAPVVEKAARHVAGVRAGHVLALRPTARGVGALAAAVAVLVGLSAAWPSLAGIGARRMLLPWAGAEWPKRTELADATPASPHPLGTALSLRAALTKADRPAEAVRVAAHYRVVEDGRAGPERRVLLTAQTAAAEGVAHDGSPARGTLFERLVEPAGLSGAGAARADARADAGPATLEYWFETDDDRTPKRSITLVRPPTVVHAWATVTLPPYAGSLLGAGEGASSGPTRLDLGAGGDDRAAPAPILVGSEVILTVELSKPVPVPQALGAGPDPAGPDRAAAEWLGATLGPEALWLFRGRDAAPGGRGEGADAAPGPGARLSADGRTWTISWRHWDSVRLLVRPSDEHGIAAPDEAVFRLDVLKDNPPTATVTLPQEDKSVLPTATVELTGEGRDDVGLAWVALERQLARRPAGSEGAANEPEGERAEIARVLATAAPADGPAADGGGGGPPGAGGVKRALSAATLDLSTIDGLRPGDELWITAVAADAFELDGRRHEPVRSAPRKLRILSRDQLVEQIWNELGAVRRTAIKIDQDQGEAQKAAPAPGPAGEESTRRQERAQAGLTERLSRQAQGLERLAQRVRENALMDSGLDGVLREAGESLKRAGERSGSATRSLGGAARKQAEEKAGPEAGRPELEGAKDDQKGVRDELSNLIDMLDQGEDSFASRRAVERLLERQRDLQSRTQEAGRETAGKRSDQLTPEQRRTLEQIAQEQDAAAKDLRDAARKMQERAGKLSKSDPATAQAMEQAARQAQRDQTPERMEQAAQQARQNQTAQAQEQQQRAAQSLEQMLGQLNQGRKNRDEVLRRFLASLIESVRALAERQKAEIAALNAAVEAGGGTRVAAREAPMAALHQSALGVLGEAGEGPREIAPVAERLEAAADAMAAAVPELRAATADPALRHENEALDSLLKALELAEKADQAAEERQAEEKREELRGRYEDAYKRQASLRDAAQDLAGQEASRRVKAAARLLAQDQTALLEAVRKIREDTREIGAAKVFDFAHTRLDALMTDAAGRLGEGSPDALAVSAQTSAARLLKSLADSLDQRKKEEDPFRKPEGQGQGGGSGSGRKPLVPPAAEVTLLKLLQQEALDLTRAAAGAGEVEGAAKLQRDIADQGRALLDRLKKEKGAGGPAPEPGAKDPHARDGPGEGAGDGGAGKPAGDEPAGGGQ